jgi:hypothetical protein
MHFATKLVLPMVLMSAESERKNNFDETHLKQYLTMY